MQNAPTRERKTAIKQFDLVPHFPLSSRAEPRDLQFAPPVTNLRWKHHLPLVIPTGAKRSVAEGPAVLRPTVNRILISPAPACRGTEVSKQTDLRFH